MVPSSSSAPGWGATRLPRLQVRRDGTSRGENQTQTSPHGAGVRDRTVVGGPQAREDGGEGAALLHPFPGGISVSSLGRRRKQTQRRVDGPGQSSFRLFAFWPGEHSRSQELLLTQEKSLGPGRRHGAALRPGELRSHRQHAASAAGGISAGDEAETEATVSAAACWP